MVTISLSERPLDWWNNYYYSLKFRSPQPERNTDDTARLVLQDHRAILYFSTDTMQWLLDFEDERDYIAMVLKWS